MICVCVCGGGGGGGGGSLCEIQTYVQPDTRHSDQISRSARRDGATKKVSEN